MDTNTLLLILLPLVLVQISVQAYALFDLWKHKGAKGNTPVWILIIVLFQIFGPLVYFLFGRREEST